LIYFDHRAILARSHDILIPKTEKMNWDLPNYSFLGSAKSLGKQAEQEGEHRIAFTNNRVLQWSSFAVESVDGVA